MSKSKRGKQPQQPEDIIFSLKKGETLEEAIERTLKETRKEKKSKKQKDAERVLFNLILSLSGFLLYFLLLTENS
jgi:ABC-type hemin transport system substrate-binding protein